VTVLLNGADGGISGSAVTTGNSGGASGNPFDGVAIGAGNTVNFDNTQVIHGPLSYTFACGATPGLAELQWSTSMGTQAEVWFRMYLYLTANPAATIRLFAANQVTTACANLVVLTTGHFQARAGAAGTPILGSTNAIPLNAWFRVEGFFIGDAAVGQVQYSVYDTPDSTVATETQTSAANLNTTGTMDHYTFGISTNTANVVQFWMDSLGVSSAGFIGPDVPAASAGTFDTPRMNALHKLAYIGLS
jgi:hypothetical protein